MSPSKKFIWQDRTRGISRDFVESGVIRVDSDGFGHLYRKSQHMTSNMFQYIPRSSQRKRYSSPNPIDKSTSAPRLHWAPGPTSRRTTTPSRRWSECKGTPRDNANVSRAAGTFPCKRSPILLILSQPSYRGPASLTSKARFPDTGILSVSSPLTMEPVTHYRTQTGETIFSNLDVKRAHFGPV